MSNVDSLPSLFVSHGAPDILLSEHEAAGALRDLGRRLPEPRAILIVSAHWVDNPVGITAGRLLPTLHDFGGFPDALYRMQYPAKGDDALSADVARRLQEKGLESRLHDARGLDHGAWIPLTIMYPEARIPVVQVSLPTGSLADAAQMGAALAPLRHQGALVVGSGGSVHNLRTLKLNREPDDWAIDFEQWLLNVIEGNRFIAW